MQKTLIAALVVVAVLSSLAGEASAIGRRRQRGAVNTAPATTAQAAPSGTGYRTYSYEPASSTTGTSTIRTTRVPPHMNAGGHTAGYKLTDF